MVAIKPREAERFLADPDPNIRIVLFFGPDIGRSSVRADRLSKILTASGGEIVRLDGDAVATSPDLLMTEAYGVALFAPVVGVRLREGQRSLASALKPLVEAPPDRMIIVEAGDLKPSSPTRKLIEKAANGATIGSYSDDARSVGETIDRLLGAAGIAIDPMARDVLVTRLGADHLVSRSELDKLLLYIHPRQAVTVDDVAAICGDSSAALRDDFIDAVAARRTDRALQTFQGLLAEGVSPVPLVSQLVRHFSALHRAVAIQAAGRGTEQALRAFVPPLHFRRRPSVEAQMRSWSESGLVSAMSRLHDVELTVRTRPELAETVVERMIFQLCGASPAAKVR